MRPLPEKVKANIYPHHQWSVKRLWFFSYCLICTFFSSLQSIKAGTTSVEQSQHQQFTKDLNSHTFLHSNSTRFPISSLTPTIHITPSSIMASRISTHRGIPSIQDIMNSVHPSWDGSDTLRSSRDMINHRNMLLQAFWPAENLISTTSLKAADQAMLVIEQRHDAPLVAILLVPGQPHLHQRMVIELPTSSSVSYRGSNPGNYSYSPER